MSVALAYLMWGLILAVVAVCVVVAAWAVKDALAAGDRTIQRPMDEMDAARNVTGRTGQ